MLTDGLERRYVISTMERRYDLENVTPFELVFLVPTKWEKEPDSYIPPLMNKKIESRSWTQLIKELVIYLQEKSPKSKEVLLEYRTDWSKAPIFTTGKAIDNMVKIDGDLYCNINHTATHSSWLIGDLLRLYDLNLGFIIVHRPPEAEPEEIKKEIGDMRRKEFKEYLISVYGKSEESANKIIKNIDVLNKILVKMGTSYNDFFLFDSTVMLSTYKSKVLLNIRKYVAWEEKQIEKAKRYLDYLSNYYTKVMKEAKNHKDRLDYWVPII